MIDNNKIERLAGPVAKAFTLIEVVSVLTIAALIMIATLNVYDRVRKTTSSINERLQENLLTTEILQRIAQDIDRLAAPGFDTTVTIKNVTEAGYNKAQLIIENKIYGTDNKPKTFERVSWHTFYDAILEQYILYRSHGGMALEDQLIDTIESGEEATSQASLQKLGHEPYIPIASGMTFFEIVAVNDENILRQWSATAPPNAIAISISFAPYVENIDGEFEIPPEEIFTRSVAVDRTRKIKYKFIAREFDDPNSLYIDDIDNDLSDPNEPNQEQDDSKIR